MSVVDRSATVWGVLFASLTTPAAAASDAERELSSVLGQEPAVALELVETRVTAYAQEGEGYQSQAGPIGGPGSESLTVFQTQAAFVARQGPRIVHRLWVPVDIVTGASSDANDRYFAEPDVVSRASAHTQAEELNYDLTLRASPSQSLNGGVAFHNEENFRSWRISLGYQAGFADDNATLSASVNQVLDWFDVYELGGKRIGRTTRSSSNLNLGLSQLLSPTTLIALGYGLTLQRGTLGNTSNTVPTDDGERVVEHLPERRDRHALWARLGQWLPWDGALDVRYRFYADDWSVLAHTVEVELRQRVFPWLELHGGYRRHDQTAVSYFTTLADAGQTYGTADSDLGALDATTLEAGLGLSLPWSGWASAFVDFAYARYWRSDGLGVDMATCASGLRF